MKARYACNSAEHVSRRSFLQGATTGALSLMGFAGMTQARAAQQLASAQKQVVVFWLAGGVLVGVLQQVREGHGAEATGDDAASNNPTPSGFD